MTRHHTPQVEIQTLPLDAPWRWLQKGWQDFKQAPLIGLLHGLGVSLFGFLLLVIAFDDGPMSGAVGAHPVRASPAR